MMLALLRIFFALETTGGAFLLFDLTMIQTAGFFCFICGIYCLMGTLKE